MSCELSWESFNGYFHGYYPNEVHRQTLYTVSLEYIGECGRASVDYHDYNKPEAATIVASLILKTMASTPGFYLVNRSINTQSNHKSQQQLFVNGIQKLHLVSSLSFSLSHSH